MLIIGTELSFVMTEELSIQPPTIVQKTLLLLTPGVSVDVLLAGEEQARVKGGEDEAVVARLPVELDVGGVGDAGNGDAVALLGGSAEGLGHLLATHAPVRRHEGRAAQEQRQDCLDEGQARGTHLLQERHGAGVKGGFGLVGGWRDGEILKLLKRKNELHRRSISILFFLFIWK